MEKMAATAPPVKQLHNFPLSLKWGAQAQPQPYRPDPDSESDPDPEPQPRLRHPPPRVGSRSARLHRFSFTSCSSASRPAANKSHKLPPPPPPPPPTARRPVVVVPEKQAEVEEDESSSRPWKLRPRKQNSTALVEVKEPAQPPPVTAEPKSMRLRGAAAEPSGEGGGGVILETKKEKRKIWIALSREEIEEDVFIMTGSRPARRPKKRPKNVQKLLDNVFPGLWLVGATADSFRLAEAPARR